MLLLLQMTSPHGDFTLQAGRRGHCGRGRAFWARRKPPGVACISVVTSLEKVGRDRGMEAFYIKSGVDTYHGI